MTEAICGQHSDLDDIFGHLTINEAHYETSSKDSLFSRVFDTAELACQIISHISFEQLPALRHVCKTFDATATSISSHITNKFEVSGTQSCEEWSSNSQMNPFLDLAFSIRLHGFNSSFIVIAQQDNLTVPSLIRGLYLTKPPIQEAHLLIPRVPIREKRSRQHNNVKFRRDEIDEMKCIKRTVKLHGTRGLTLSDLHHYMQKELDPKTQKGIPVILLFDGQYKKAASFALAPILDSWIDKKYEQSLPVHTWYRTCEDTEGLGIDNAVWSQEVKRWTWPHRGPVSGPDLAM